MARPMTEEEYKLFNEQYEKDGQEGKEVFVKEGKAKEGEIWTTDDVQDVFEIQEFYGQIGRCRVVRRADRAEGYLSFRDYKTSRVYYDVDIRYIPPKDELQSV